MTLQQKLERIGNALVEGLTQDGELICGVYHYWRSQKGAPFVVWAESYEDEPINGDNRKAEQAIRGYVDAYSKTEFDPLFDDVQSILNGLAEDMPFGWMLDSVQYEEETNLIHYQWIWSVA